MSSRSTAYTDGELHQAITRGDGVRGDEVTRNVRTIPSLPQWLAEAPAELEVRGEVYMPLSGFSTMNAALFHHVGARYQYP